LLVEVTIKDTIATFHLQNNCCG